MRLPMVPGPAPICRELRASGVPAGRWKSAVRNRRAFTLLEIMIAMALFVMVVAAIYASWSAIVRGSRAGMQAAAAAERSHMAMQTIQEALDSARSFAANLQYYWFAGENGDNAELSFVSRLPDSFPRSGRFGDFDLRRVTFSLQSAPDSFSKQLVLRQNPVLMDMDDDEKNHPVLLAQDVREFKIEFWEDKEGDWTDEWTEHTNQLPKMVRITLQLGSRYPQARPQEEVTRVIALPSVTVQPGWQAGTAQGRPPGLGGGINLNGPNVNQNPPRR